MTANQKLFLTWLRDAHAMEEKSLVFLKHCESLCKGHASFQEAISRHIAETEFQKSSLHNCLVNEGENVSVTKDMTTKTLAHLENITPGANGTLSGGGIVDIAISLSTFEHMEIATYRALIAAARETGELEIAKACEQAIEQEKAMASWIDDHIAEMTAHFMQTNRRQHNKAWNDQ